jgi:hypothetical protein
MALLKQEYGAEINKQHKNLKGYAAYVYETSGKDSDSEKTPSLRDLSHPWDAPDLPRTVGFSQLVRAEKKPPSPFREPLIGHV